MLYRRRLRHPPNTFGQPGKAHKARRTEPRRRGRSTPLLHSWFVQRGDGLILRTLSPNFALTPKLQHYRSKHSRLDWLKKYRSGSDWIDALTTHESASRSSKSG